MIVWNVMIHGKIDSSWENRRLADKEVARLLREEGIQVATVEPERVKGR